MARLIDADELMSVLQNFFDKREKDQIFSDGKGANVSWNDAIHFIKTAPTVDAVPVVRCKDCKHRILNEHYGEKGYFKLKATCELDTGDIFSLARCAEDDNWFCKDGKPKGGGE